MFSKRKGTTYLERKIEKERKGKGEFSRHGFTIVVQEKISRKGGEERES